VNSLAHKTNESTGSCDMTITTNDIPYRSDNYHSMVHLQSVLRLSRL